MVSFQCDACTDVVKKPKLDRHYGQCQASFTCIDCSATFASPSQWKSHTSCITEAEKYQKSLYKGSKKVSGNHRNTQPEVAKIPGANTTPLRSPPRMSPVDSSAVDSSVNGAKTEREVGKKRDSEVPAEVHTSNAGQQKIGVVSELPQEPPSVVNGSTKKQRKSKKSSPKPETQTSSRELAPEKDRSEKKSKKRKRKEANGDGSNAMEQTDAHLEATPFHLNDKSKDEKKAKKRKLKEKRDDVSPSKQNDVADEETRMELEATDTDAVKERAKKKKKSKDKKASAEKTPVSDEVTGGEKRKKRKKSES